MLSKGCLQLPLPSVLTLPGPRRLPSSILICTGCTLLGKVERGERERRRRRKVEVFFYFSRFIPPFVSGEKALK